MANEKCPNCKGNFILGKNTFDLNILEYGCNVCKIYYYPYFQVCNVRGNQSLFDKGIKINEIISMYTWNGVDYLEYEFHKLMKLKGFL